MALPEKNEVTADLETQAMVSEEELNDSKQEEDEKENEDADQEMNCEDDNDDGEALDLDLHEEDEPEKPKDRTCIPVVWLLVDCMFSCLTNFPYKHFCDSFLDRCVKRKKKKAGSNSSSFTEGWVEFRDKRIAKRVCTTHPWPTRRGATSCSYFFSLFFIKYLHRFQWCHLCERLAYEQTVYHQRMRTEISQAKKETNFYLASVEKSQNLENLRKKKEKKGEVVEEKTWDYKQRPTEEEIHLKWFLSKKNLQKARKKSKSIQEKAQSNVSLLAKIFSSGRAQE
uniref:Activator of basal transcription 1 n=1 Tax=Cyprinus carpio TaxID=7962 RepID=A0A8C2J152_CYPCA